MQSNCYVTPWPTHFQRLNNTILLTANFIFQFVTSCCYCRPDLSVLAGDQYCSEHNCTPPGGGGISHGEVERNQELGGGLYGLHLSFHYLARRDNIKYDKIR